MLLSRYLTYCPRWANCRQHERGRDRWQRRRRRFRRRKTCSGNRGGVIWSGTSTLIVIASQGEDDHLIEGVSMPWCPGRAPRSTPSTSQSHKVVNNRNVLHMQQTKGIVISSSRMILEAWKIVLFRLPQIRTERQRTMWMRSTSRSLTKPSPRKTLL